MKITQLSVQMSLMAMDVSGGAFSPDFTVGCFYSYLQDKLDIVGNFIDCEKVAERDFDTDLAYAIYEMRYEKYTIKCNFSFLKSTGKWDFQGFQFLAVSAAKEEAGENRKVA